MDENRVFIHKNRYMSRLIILFIVVIFASCVKDIRVEPQMASKCGQVNSVSVQDIREAIGQGSLYIDEDLVLEVTVIANDYENNFFKKIVAADETGGFELLVGTYDMHRQFPIGRSFHIAMKGLSVDLHNEVMRVGLSKHSLDVEPPEYFNYYYILDRYVCDCTYYPDMPEPEIMTLLELSSDMCGQLVTVTDIINNKYGLAWAKVGREHIYFKDKIGNRIVVETSAYAEFASDIVPNVEVEITGVLSLQMINEELFYTLRMRNLYDVSSK